MSDGPAQGQGNMKDENAVNGHGPTGSILDYGRRDAKTIVFVMALKINWFKAGIEIQVCVFVLG
jgi:hypothetical protein